MDLQMKIRANLVRMLMIASSFAAGWLGSTYIERGQHAMASFMDSYSALAYLQKKDVSSAMLLLRASAEAHMIEAEKYGDLNLWIHDSGAMSKWFVGYEKLRLKLPESSKGPESKEFDNKVNEVLKAAAKKVKSNGR
jgi:hypothetical protein